MMDTRITVEGRVLALKRKIEQAAIECGLNLTVYDGRIGFVDQEQKKIVALWTPEHTMRDLEGGN